MKTRAYSQLTDDDKDIIIGMYYDMIPFAEIAPRQVVSQRAVSRVLKEAGINTRLKNRYTLDDSYFNVIDTQEKAYLLGLLYADGFVGDEMYNNIVISLKESDKALLQRFAKEIAFTGELQYLPNSGGYEGSQPAWKLSFSSKEMAEALRLKGLTPGKSLTMEDLPELPDELIRHFIRGYFDGDGSAYTNRSVSSHKLSDGTVKVYEYQRPEISIIGTTPFIEKLMAIVGVETTVKASKTPNMIYMVCRKRDELLTLYKYFYDGATIYMDRKYNKWTQMI